MGVEDDLALGKAAWNKWAKDRNGWPPDLSRLIIKTEDLKGYSFRGCRCYSTDFGEAEVFGADLRHAKLQNAKLDKVKGLTEAALGGANLRGAKLPEAFEFSGLDSLKDAGRRILNTQWMILLLGFIFLAGLFEINSEAYFSPNNILLRFKLPGGWGNLGVVTFIASTTVLITVYSLILHFFIRRLWWEWRDLPSWFPDGKNRRQKLVVYPWLEIVRVREPITPAQRKIAGVRMIDSLICLVLAFPIGVLILAWFAILSFHSKWLTALIFACTLILIGSQYVLIKPRLPIWMNKTPCSSLLTLAAMVAGFYGFVKGWARWEWALMVSVALIAFIALVWSKSRKREGGLATKQIASLWHYETPISVLTIGAMVTPWFLLVCGGFMLQRVLFDEKSQSWSILQANLALAQLSKKMPEYKASGDYRENEFRVKGIQLEDRNLNGARLIGSFLFNAEMSGAKLKSADLSSADLRGGNFQDAHLENAQMQGARLNYASFKDAHLQGVQLAKAYVSHVDFSGADLTGANTKQVTFKLVTAPGAKLNELWLRNATFEKPARKIQLRKAKLMGAIFAGCDLYGADFSEAILTGANFRGAKLTGKIKFSKANLENADFANAIFEDADLRTSNLSAAKIDKVVHFKASQLDGLQFNYLNLPNSVFERCSMIGCNFEKSELLGAHFIDAKLQYAVFEGCNLLEANFSRANLEQTTLRCSNLRRATFRFANLKGTNFSNSDLRGADFSKASNYDDPNHPCKVDGALIDEMSVAPAFKQWALKNGAFIDEKRWQSKRQKDCY